MDGNEIGNLLALIARLGGLQGENKDWCTKHSGKVIVCVLYTSIVTGRTHGSFLGKPFVLLNSE